MKKSALIVVFAFIAFSQSSLAGQAFNAGTIKNEKDSQMKCPAVCAANGRTWNKEWRTTKESAMSLCICNDQVNAGPIFKQEEAKIKCPAVCASQNSLWNGHWRTTDEERMSTCDCEDNLKKN